jgi:hypothetical protein
VGQRALRWGEVFAVDTFTNGTDKSGAVLTGTVTASGAATIGGTLTASGAANVGGVLGVTGAANVGGILTVTGAASIGGTLTVTGAASLASNIITTSLIGGTATLNAGFSGRNIVWTPGSGNNLILPSLGLGINVRVLMIGTGAALATSTITAPQAGTLFGVIQGWTGTPIFWSSETVVRVNVASPWVITGDYVDFYSDGTSWCILWFFKLCVHFYTGSFEVLYATQLRSRQFEMTLCKGTDPNLYSKNACCTRLRFRFPLGGVRLSARARGASGSSGFRCC